jgi:hypothetical protein
MFFLWSTRRFSNWSTCLWFKKYETYVSFNYQRKSKHGIWETKFRFFMKRVVLLRFVKDCCIKVLNAEDFRGLFFITRDIHCTQQVERMSKTFQAWCCSTEIVSNSGRSLWIGLKWNLKNVIVYKKPHSCFRPFCFSLLVALKRRLIRNLSSKVCLIEEICYIWNKFLQSFIPITLRWNALCSW